MASGKQVKWLKHFLDVENSDTFLNKRASALAAGYKSGTAGSANFLYYKDKIDQWLEDVGLSENALKIKLLSMLDAKETKLFAFQGVVIDERDVEAFSIQQKALDMAFKIKGLYAPERHEHKVQSGITPTDGAIKPGTDPKEAALIYAQLVKQDDEE